MPGQIFMISPINSNVSDTKYVYWEFKMNIRKYSNAHTVLTFNDTDNSEIPQIIIITFMT